MPTTTEIGGRRVDRSLTVFYAVVALIALAGQTGAAVEWLRWPLLFALGAVAAVEFGGIVLSVYGDHRRRLGERALAARILSAAVAAGAVAVNWLGHADRLQAGFFAGMSALGYLVWLLHSGARRRDQLRASGDLPPVPPVYGAWSWLRHPGLTRRARALALADPSLGLYASLAAAREAMRTERRQAAVAALLRRKLAEGRDELAAEIAVSVYDLDEVAARLAAGADYDGLAALLAADLTPDRLAGGAETVALAEAPHHSPDALPRSLPGPWAPPRLPSTVPARAPVPGINGHTHPALSPPPDSRSGDDTADDTAAAITGPPVMPTDRTADQTTVTPTSRTPSAVRAMPSTVDATASRIAKVRTRNPALTQKQVADKTGLSLRTVARHWSATTPTRSQA